MKYRVKAPYGTSPFHVDFISPEETYPHVYCPHQSYFSTSPSTSAVSFPRSAPVIDDNIPSTSFAFYQRTRVLPTATSNTCTVRRPSHSDLGSLFAHLVSHLQQVRFLVQFPRRLNFCQSIEHGFSIDLDNFKKPRSTP